MNGKSFGRVFGGVMVDLLGSVSVGYVFCGAVVSWFCLMVFGVMVASRVMVYVGLVMTDLFFFSVFARMFLSRVFNIKSDEEEIVELKRKVGWLEERLRIVENNWGDNCGKKE